MATFRMPSLGADMERGTITEWHVQPGDRVTHGQIVATVDGALAFGFDVEPFRKHCLLNGLDDIGLTLQHADAIREFEAKRLAEQPWLV